MALVLIASCKRFKEYIPIVKSNDQLIEKPELLTQHDQNNIIQVLEYHREDWRLTDGKIYVSSSLAKEIIWNYSTKANDSIWLATHKPAIK